MPFKKNLSTTSKELNYYTTLRTFKSPQLSRELRLFRGYRRIQAITGQHSFTAWNDDLKTDFLASIYSENSSPIRRKKGTASN